MNRQSKMKPLDAYFSSLSLDRAFDSLHLVADNAHAHLHQGRSLETLSRSASAISTVPFPPPFLKETSRWQSSEGTWGNYDVSLNVPLRSRDDMTIRTSPVNFPPPSCGQNQSSPDSTEDLLSELPWERKIKSSQRREKNTSEQINRARDGVMAGDIESRLEPRRLSYLHDRTRTEEDAKMGLPNTTETSSSDYAGPETGVEDTCGKGNTIPVIGLSNKSGNKWNHSMDASSIPRLARLNSSPIPLDESLTDNRGQNKHHQQTTKRGTISQRIPTILSLTLVGYPPFGPDPQPQQQSTCPSVVLEQKDSVERILESAKGLLH